MTDIDRIKYLRFALLLRLTPNPAVNADAPPAGFARAGVAGYLTR